MGAYPCGLVLSSLTTSIPCFAYEIYVSTKHIGYRLIR